MTTSEKLGFQQRYGDHDDSDHRMDYLSEARADPNLHYFHDQLQQLDPATAHRLAHAGRLTAADTGATSERIVHVIDAFQNTRSDETLDEKQAKQLADQVTQGMTAFHDRERDRLDFMADRADYQLPKTPRQLELDKFETQLKARGLDYLKDDNGDITVTFPTARMRDEVLSNVPKGFTRQTSKEEKAAFGSRMAEQKALENTLIFKAEDEDEAQALQAQILADEMARRAKHRSNRIAQLLDHATSDNPGGDDDEDNDFFGKTPDEVKDDVAHQIAELLHQQYEDDNKTLIERLQDIPVPDPSSRFDLDEVNRFTNDDFRSRLFAMKVDYNLQDATEAIDEHLHDPGEAQAANQVLNRVAQLYHNTLTKFADADDGVKFHAYEAQVSEVGSALLERVQSGTSLVEDSNIDITAYAGTAPPGDPDNLEPIHQFRTETRQALNDSADELPQYINVVATHLLQHLDTQAASYQDYIDNTPSPDDTVTRDLDRQAQDTIAQLEWLLKK